MTNISPSSDTQEGNIFCTHKQMLYCFFLHKYVVDLGSYQFYRTTKHENLAVKYLNKRTIAINNFPIYFTNKLRVNE